MENRVELDLAGCKLIGKGRNGRVYLLPDGRAVKVCKTEKSCLKEYSILEKVKGNQHFPMVYEYGGNYMIRDYVQGQGLKEYIRENGLPWRLAMNLIALVEEFKKLQFSKIDIRCKDIIVREDQSVMVIDPEKASFRRQRDYPKKLLYGLNKLGVYEKFKKILYAERPDLYKEWIVRKPEGN